MQVSTVTAIVPGSCFAIAVLHLVLMHPCDCAVRRWPDLQLSKYVDDLTIVGFGRAEQLLEQADDLADWLLEELEDNLEMQVSKDVLKADGTTTA